MALDQMAHSIGTAVMELQEVSKKGTQPGAVCLTGWRGGHQSGDAVRFPGDALLHALPSSPSAGTKEMGHAPSLPPERHLPKLRSRT